jgi:hypothetical protein
MVFIELPAFIRAVHGLLGDEDIQALQNELLENPERGDLIPGSGGVRKMRWAFGTKGKRGGARVIYHYAVTKQKIWLLFAYTKNVKLNLSAAELKGLKALVKELS